MKRRRARATALIFAAAAMSMVTACGDDSSGTPTSSGSSQAVTVTTGGTADQGSPQVPADWPQDVPIISGGRYKSSTAQSVGGAVAVEVYGLEPSAFDKAVDELKNAGFTPLGAIDPGTESLRTTTLNRGGTVVVLVATGQGDQYVLTYTVRKAA